jgi:uncharacterized membrane protein
VSPTGVIHMGFAVAALVIGGAVVWLPKGTRVHRLLGQLYALCMIGVLVTSFMIYGLVGGWGPFHFAAVISAVTLAAGLVPAILRWPRGTWIVWHLQFMSYSYLGLVAALFSESAVRLPVLEPIVNATGISFALAFGVAVAVPTFLTFAIGATLVNRRGMRVGRELQETVG